MFFKLMDDPVLNPEAQQGILMKRNTHQNGIQQFICLHWCPTSRHRVELRSQRHRWHWSSEPSKRLAFAIGDQFFWKVKDHLLLGTRRHVTGRIATKPSGTKSSSSFWILMTDFDVLLKISIVGDLVYHDGGLNYVVSGGAF